MVKARIWLLAVFLVLVLAAPATPKASLFIPTDLDVMSELLRRVYVVQEVEKNVVLDRIAVKLRNDPDHDHLDLIICAALKLGYNRAVEQGATKKIYDGYWED